MSKKFVICFAGVPGSSKSTIINHLSTQFNLPVFSNDQLRYEVMADLGVDDINIPLALETYNRRVKELRNEILALGNSFIFDCSVDRRWPVIKEELIQSGYSWFVISHDFTVSFVNKLQDATGRHWSVEDLNVYDKQHQEFLANYTKDVSLHLHDSDFSDRVGICLEAVKTYLKTIS
jgi:hypothetical protein